ncbi:MAG TPA: formate dehydrogenase subunit alpha [Planctomycetes bacterium]|nr:formate dehydrogenase subunit alpha [Planctomycetota bacterium]
MTNSIAEIEQSECMLVVGSNTTEAHPVLALRMKKALRGGAKLLVVDPRKTWLAERADVHLQIKPGTDIPLMNAIANVIISEDLHNKQYVESLTEGFDEMKLAAAEWPVERAAAICEVDAGDIRKAARLYAAYKHAGIYYTLGITEHVCGVDNVRSLSNLALITGHLGYEATGVNPLRGQNNVQGCNDMGNNPVYLPGYQEVADGAAREKFSAAWGHKVPEIPGRRLDQMLDGLHDESIKAFFVMGEDPIVSEPNVEHVHVGFKKLELLISQDIFLNETAKIYADVVFPATCFAEKEGTFTNSERRVQRVRKAVDAPGEARTDLQIIFDLAKELGHDWGKAQPSKVWDEFARLSPDFSGINYARIEESGIQWPCPDVSHPGTKFLHEGAPIRGKGKLYPLDHIKPWEEADDDYPLTLSTGRTLYHYNAATQTLRNEGHREKQPKSFVEISAEDARELNIVDKEEIVVQSRRGSIVSWAKVSEKVRKGVIWMPMHYAEASVNILTGDGKDLKVGTPEYKLCAVRLHKP